MDTEPDRVIQCLTTCGCSQYITSPPGALRMASLELPAGFLPNVRDMNGKAIAATRQFGFVNETLMTDIDGKQLIVLLYREGHKATSAISLV